MSNSIGAERTSSSAIEALMGCEVTAQLFDHCDQGRIAKRRRA
jgi:hypothetical protein